MDPNATFARGDVVTGAPQPADGAATRMLPVLPDLLPARRHRSTS